jgi:hypothetical protein
MVVAVVAVVDVCAGRAAGDRHKVLRHVGQGAHVVAQHGDVLPQEEPPAARPALPQHEAVRLVAGRLPLERTLEQGAVTATGDRTRLLSLTRMVRGIGGGS